MNKYNNAGLTPKLTRRQFLKSSVFAAGAAVAGTGAARAGLPGPDAEPLATLIDISRCIGCEECVYACRQANAPKFPEPERPFPRMYPSRVKVEDWSDRKDVTDRLTPYNWLYIQYATGVRNGEKITLSIPRRCMHCQNPPCVKLCPWGAAKQEKNGLSRIDARICLGGSKCKTVCPWDIPQRQTGTGLYLDLLPAFAGNGVMYKCDRCYQKLEKGALPACIDICPEEVQVLGPRSEIVALAEDRAREMDGYIYGLDENGGTLTLYVSPVPFDQLAFDTGPGRPHLAPVADTMADGNNLALALVIAPVAGAAAAIAKFYKNMKDTA
ncbi:MAG TPA: 4Fe-4S dicluster domain-containing protein [Desulfotignum sp.]|jgi:formate dehydrogenase iron-sulfur subunit|nr:4Fe-4S dicluster domain-containing protein [Desulfotignum sp.]